MNKRYKAIWINLILFKIFSISGEPSSKMVSKDDINAAYTFYADEQVIARAFAAVPDADILPGDDRLAG